MGCSGCGSGSILPGSRTARALSKLRAERRVRGYSGSGVIKGAKRLAAEAKAAKKAAKASQE